MARIRLLPLGLLVACGALVSASAFAAEAFTASGTTCRDITWKPDVLAKYPNIAAACQGVVQQAGETYVKFTGTVANNSPAGLRMKFKGAGDQSVLIKPSASQTVKIHGQTYNLRDMQQGQEMDFYIPASRFAASLGDEPEAVSVVEIIEISPLPVPEPTPAPGEAASLPKTASDLPWLAVLGALVMLGAIGVTALRRYGRVRK